MPGSSSLASILTLTAIGYTAWYLLACTVWPFTACRHCDGTGRHRSPSGRAWRTCRHCKATGTKVRTGRRIWTRLRAEHDRGTDR